MPTTEELKRLVGRLRIQRLPEEMGEETRAEADWRGGYTGAIRDGRKAATTIEALQARVREMEGQCERSTVIECGWREQVRDMKPKMENAERKLAEIAEIASNSNKRGWSDFDRIAALAKVTS